MMYVASGIMDYIFYAAVYINNIRSFEMSFAYMHREAVNFPIRII